MTNNEVNDSSYQDYQVSVSEAQTVALQFMKQLYPARYGQSKVLSVSMQNMEDGLPGLYRVDVEPEGWVMVSSDKRYAPVMAYSTEGNISNVKESDIPLASVFWLEMNLAAQKQTPGDDASNIKQWNQLLSNDTAAIIDPDDCVEVSSYMEVETYGRYDPQTRTYQGYVTSQWHQRYPYNYRIASVYNANYPAGCTTIAFAQIVRYWEHAPNSYNWNIMADEYASIYQAGASEVARLIYDAATEIRVNYSTGATGAPLNDGSNNDRDVFEAFEDWGYNVLYKRWESTARNRDPVPITQAMSYDDLRIIGDEMRNERPIVFAGFPGPNMPGHAWVCDGYSTAYLVHIFSCTFPYGDIKRKEFFGNYLHMNWGWGENMNGWYNYNTFYQTDAFHYGISDNNVYVIYYNPNAGFSFGYGFQMLYEIKPQ